MTAMKTSLKASLIATAIAALPFGTHAAGLGSLNVFSGLGQPLRAEIELNATPHELESLTAKIASAEAFRQASLAYSPVISALRLAVERRGNGAVLRLTSDRPLNEPFVDMLLELNWAAGRLIREYTFLLDPVPLNGAAPVAAALLSPASPSVSATAPVGAHSRGDAHGRDAAPVDYEVRAGDTLHSIAEAHRPRNATLDQMLVALFRSNAAAFDGGNMNRLRAGSVLSLPAANDVAALAPAAARREVLAQAADFEAYRRRLAGVVGAAPSAEPEPAREAAGNVIPKVAESASGEAAGDRVKVSRAADAAAPAPTDSEGLSRLQSLEEELVARDKALEEANARLAALEASIREMQRLLEVRSQNLAQLQPQPDPAPSSAANALPVDAPSDGAGRQAAVPLDSRSSTRAAPGAPSAPPEVAEAGVFDGLLDDPKLLAGGGGILALLLGYFGIKLRERRRAEQELADSQAVLSELSSETHSVFGTTGGQSVDTTESSILQSDFSQSDFSAIDANEGVDPVAEADVYMAYGRDAQAEEILLDALKADSSRPAIFLKLLEIYANRNSVRQFEDVAGDFYARTGGAGPHWEQAAELGRRVAPGNPLFGASGESPVVPAIPSAQRRPDMGAPAHAPVGSGARASDEFDARRRDAQPVAPHAPALTRPVFGASASATYESERAQDAAEKAVPVSALTASGTGIDLPTALPDLDLERPNARPSPVPVVDPLPDIESSTLDFELDLASHEVTSASGERPAVPEPLPEAADPHVLEFDFHIGDDLAPTPSVDESMSATMIGNGQELGAEEGAGDERESAEALPQPVLADLDLSATEVMMPELSAEPHAPELEETTFDTSLLDFDFNLDEPAPCPAPGTATPIFDFSEIDLELDAPETFEEAPVAQANDVAVEFDDAARQEVETKLELARAYEEMGDKNGARELIEEVLREGSAEQQAVARRLMDAVV